MSRRTPTSASTMLTSSSVGGAAAGAGAGGSAGGATTSSVPSILARPLPRDKVVNIGSFGYLFSELVQYTQARVQNVADLERKLDEVGYDVGYRFLELIMSREKPSKRETSLVELLKFIKVTMWKVIFGKPADSLERGTDQDGVYMIRENEPLTNKFISVPRSDYGRLNCAAYVGGILRGIVDGAGFTATVTTHLVDVAGGEQTVFMMKFDPEVMARDASTA